jgi:hypothetical protein
MKAAITGFVAQLALLFMLGCLSSAGLAQVARTEVIPVPSVTMTDQEFLTGLEDGRPVTIAGELRLPKAGVDRLPLVILLHGSGGVASSVTDWEQDLLAMGVATFVLDSFSGRGIINTTMIRLSYLVWHKPRTPSARSRFFRDTPGSTRQGSCLWDFREVGKMRFMQA